MGLILILAEELALHASLERLVQEHLDLENQKQQLMSMANSLEAAMSNGLGLFDPTTLLSMSGAQQNWAAYQNCMFQNEIAMSMQNPQTQRLMAQGLPNNPQMRRAALGQRVRAIIQSSKQKIIEKIKKSINALCSKINMRQIANQSEQQTKTAQLQQLAGMKKAAMQREYPSQG